MEARGCNGEEVGKVKVFVMEVVMRGRAKTTLVENGEGSTFLSCAV
jgi:hypothetical protein